MSVKTKLQLRLSEIRTELGRLAEAETLDEAKRAKISELRTELQDVEVRYQAALASETDANRQAQSAQPDAEHRERVELRNRASLGRMFLAAMDNSHLDGPEAEYRAAIGSLERNQIPLDYWERFRPEEVRNDAASVSPTTGTGVSVQSVQPFVFKPSIASQLRIEMPTVGTGTFSEMVISQPLAGAAVAKGTARNSTAATLTAVTATPRRISARLSLQMEDIASVGTPSFESSLRANLSLALSNAIDNQIVNGDGQAPNVNGLVNQLTNPADPTAVAEFDDFVEAVADSVDGIWARDLTHVRTLLATKAWVLSAKVYRDTTNTKRDISAASYLASRSAGWRAAERLQTTAGNVSTALAVRTGQSVRVACLPVWNSLTIDDPYSDAASGLKHVTAHVLVGSQVVLNYADAYRRLEFKVA